MNVLVIGGTRFIGRATVERLVAAGHRVTLFNRGRAPGEPPAGTESITGDRMQLGDHRAAFEALAPEVVLDMVAVRDTHGEQLVDVFGGIARRVVLVSSCDVYRAYGLLIGTDTGEPVPTPVTEQAPLRENRYPYRRPDTPESETMYHYDKIPMEQAVMASDQLAGTVLRLPMVYGPNDYQRRLYGYLRRMDDGRPHILVDAAQAGWRTARGYVGNVADAIAAAVTDDRAAGRIYNVADEPQWSEVEWLEQLAQVTGWTGEVKVLPSDKLPESLRFGSPTAHDLTIDSTRLRSELGWHEATAVSQAIDETIAWDRANPPQNLPEGAFDYAAEDAAVS